MQFDDPISSDDRKFNSKGGSPKRHSNNGKKRFSTPNENRGGNFTENNRFFGEFEINDHIKFIGSRSYFAKVAVRKEIPNRWGGTTSIHCKKIDSALRGVAKRMSSEQVSKDPVLEMYKRMPKETYKTIIGSKSKKRHVKNVRMPPPKTSGKKR